MEYIPIVLFVAILLIGLLDVFNPKFGFDVVFENNFNDWVIIPTIAIGYYKEDKVFYLHVEFLSTYAGIELTFDKPDS